MKSTAIGLKPVPLLICLGLLIASVLGSAYAQNMRPLQLNVFREDPATTVGRLKGFFAAEGLEVQVTNTPNSTDQMRGLSKGQFQIVSTAFDNVLAWSGREGAELIAVSQIIDTTVYPVIVRPEIKSWGDLKGRVLAVDAADTAFALVLRRVLLDKGLDLTRGDYTFDPVGGTQRRLDVMLKGTAFAAVLTAPQDGQAIAAGMIRMGDSGESLPNFPHTIFATNRTWAEKERGQMVGYLRAWLASAAWIRANREEAIRMMETTQKVNTKVAATMVDELSRTAALNPKALEMVLNLRNQFKLTPPMGPSIARYYDLQYFDAAAKR